jgi:hypothetical protein
MNRSTGWSHLFIEGASGIRVEPSNWGSPRLRERTRRFHGRRCLVSAYKRRAILYAQHVHTTTWLTGNYILHSIIWCLCRSTCAEVIPGPYLPVCEFGYSRVIPGGRGKWEFNTVQMCRLLPPRWQESCGYTGCWRRISCVHRRL